MQNRVSPVFLVGQIPIVDHFVIGLVELLEGIACLDRKALYLMVETSRNIMKHLETPNDVMVETARNI